MRWQRAGAGRGRRGLKCLVVLVVAVVASLVTAGCQPGIPPGQATRDAARAAAEAEAKARLVMTCRRALDAVDEVFGLGPEAVEIMAVSGDRLPSGRYGQYCTYRDAAFSVWRLESVGAPTTGSALAALLDVVLWPRSTFQPLTGVGDAAAMEMSTGRVAALDRTSRRDRVLIVQVSYPSNQTGSSPKIASAQRARILAVARRFLAAPCLCTEPRDQVHEA